MVSVAIACQISHVSTGRAKIVPMTAQQAGPYVELTRRQWADLADGVRSAVLGDAALTALDVMTLARVEAGAGDAPTYRGDPDGREFSESVEDEVDSLTCPHCGGKVPRG